MASLNLDDKKKSAYTWQNDVIAQIKNNTGDSKAYGFERSLKLLLVYSRYIFPAFHIGACYWNKGQTEKDKAIEKYVLFKLIFSILILSFQLFHLIDLPYWENPFFYWICYMMIETLFYPAMLIFCSDYFPKPSSFKRDIIFIFIDYLMVVIDFASLYLIVNALCNTKDIQITNSLDSLYFSFASALTIGFGDIVVQTSMGKLLVISQAIISLVYGVFFISFYISRIDNDKKKEETPAVN